MKRLIVAAAVALVGCSASRPAEETAPKRSVVLATFTGEVDTRNGTVSIRTDDSHGPGSTRALIEEITGVTVANDGGAAPTVGTACPGGAASLGVSVRIKANPYVATTLYTDVYAQIENMTPTGSEGCNSVTPPDGSGLSNQFGLWHYPTLGGEAGVATFWAFGNPSGAKSFFSGKVYGTATTVTAVKTVFVTSSAYPGNLGGVDGADAKCQALAAPLITAGKLSGSTYKAFLSAETRRAADILGEAVFVRPDGVILADNKSDLMVLGGSPRVPITIQEDGTEESGDPYVWTGTLTGGSRTYQDCMDWSDSWDDYAGSVGWDTESGWVFVGDLECGSSARLYCFQQ